jgi:hypothetical protein
MDMQGLNVYVERRSAPYGCEPKLGVEFIDNQP